MDTLDFGGFVAQTHRFLGRFHRPPRALEGGGLRGEFASAADAAAAVRKSVQLARQRCVHHEGQRFHVQPARRCRADRVAAASESTLIVSLRGLKALHDASAAL